MPSYKSVWPETTEEQIKKAAESITLELRARLAKVYGMRPEVGEWVTRVDFRPCFRSDTEQQPEKQDVNPNMPMVKQLWYDEENNNLATDPRFPEWRVQIFEVRFDHGAFYAVFACEGGSCGLTGPSSPLLHSLLTGSVALDAFRASWLDVCAMRKNRRC